MIPWLRKFFTDETAFVGFVRAACIGLGTAVASGLVDIPDEWRISGVLLAGLGGFIRAGEKNREAQP